FLSQRRVTGTCGHDPGGALCGSEITGSGRDFGSAHVRFSNDKRIGRRAGYSALAMCGNTRTPNAARLKHAELNGEYRPHDYRADAGRVDAAILVDIGVQ